MATINGDGRQTRDYVYVSDVARANLAALTYDGPPLVVNIGSGQETDVVTLFKLIREEAGVTIGACHGPPMMGEQRRSVLGCALAKQVLGWTSLVSLSEGIRNTVDWFASRYPA